jgi:hypothetical protein
LAPVLTSSGCCDGIDRSNGDRMWGSDLSCSLLFLPKASRPLTTLTTRERERERERERGERGDAYSRYFLFPVRRDH